MLASNTANTAAGATAAGATAVAAAGRQYTASVRYTTVDGLQGNS